MAKVVGYERPATLVEALDLLSRPGSVALAGGTSLNANATTEPVVAVDLQALGLDRVEQLDDGALWIGAMTTLQRLVDEPRAPAAVREAARRELPSTLRAAATVGGCIAAAEPESELLAALLVHEARVTIAGPGSHETVALDELLGSGGLSAGRVITGIRIEVGGSTAIARTARTRADSAIVAAAARRTPAGERLLALAGVAPRPLLVSSLDTLDPPGDFRGSTEYRRALAVVLTARALEAVS